MTHDLVVIGGGPVGLATALYAVRSGLDVVVVEPRPGDVDKACGEGLMPAGVAALADLGVHPQGRPFRAIRYLDDTRSADATFAGRPGLGVRRTTLHAALSERVARAGVEVLPLHAGTPMPDGDRTAGDAGVTVPTTGARGSTGPLLHARHVVAADGLHSPTRRGMGLAVPARGPGRYGQRQHFGVLPWTDAVEVHWGPSAEVYVTPVADDLVGVAVLSAQRVPFADQLTRFPRLRERLAGAAPASSVRGAGPLRQRTSSRVAGRVLLVGDAGGYVDALTGEGISLGLAQARAAVQAIVAGDPQRYERAWRRLTREHTVLTQGLVRATRPAWGRRWIVPAASTVPGVFTAVVRRLADER